MFIYCTLLFFARSFVGGRAAATDALYEQALILAA